MGKVRRSRYKVESDKKCGSKNWGLVHYARGRNIEILCQIILLFCGLQSAPPKDGSASDEVKEPGALAYYKHLDAASAVSVQTFT
jgi:hypothetical protein